MRVLITATSLQIAYGGPAFSVSQMATALADAGLEVGLWSADGSAADTPLVPAGSAVRRLRGDVEAAAAEFAPEAVHDSGLWLAHNHRIAGLARRRGLPRIVSTRGMLEPWAIRHKRWKKVLAWRLYQRRDLDRAAALHATAPEEAANLGPYRLAAPIHTIPNGVDLPDLPPRPAADGAWRTAVFLGRIYPVKGLPMLIDAWARVRPAGWRLVIAGPDEAGHRAEVAARAAAAGLGDVVSFPGPVLGEAKTALLREADLFVLPSHSESFGMALAEALAHEAPVLTTTAAPWPSLAQHGAGWRVEPTVDGLAEGLRTATGAGAATLRRMGEAGRALVAAEYGWPAAAGRLAALYRQAAA
ncbi:MAG TPA: glycosyltransferase [Caulobacteraceae bacterium]|jgi:glycosyltransferase involved in cell wall biosynthesis